MDFHPAIRCQTGDQLLFGAAGTAAASDRIGLATSLDSYLVGIQAFGYQIAGHALGPLLGEGQVVVVGTDAVGITDDSCDTIFRIGRHNLAEQGIERLIGSRFQGRLVELEQHIGTQTEGLGLNHGNRCRFGGRSGRRCYDLATLLTEAIEHPERNQAVIHLDAGAIERGIPQRRGVLVLQTGSPVTIDGVFGTQRTNEGGAMLFAGLAAIGEADLAIRPGIGTAQSAIKIEHVRCREADLHGGLNHLALGFGLESIGASARSGVVFAKPVITQLEAQVGVELVTGEQAQTQIIRVLAGITQRLGNRLGILVVVNAIVIGPTGLATDIPGIVLSGSLHGSGRQQTTDQYGKHGFIHIFASAISRYGRLSAHFPCVKPSGGLSAIQGIPSERSLK